MRKPWSPSFRYWLATFIVIIFVVFLWLTRALIGPLIIGGLLAFMINPVIVTLQRRSRMSKSSVVTVGLILTLGALVAIGAILSPALVRESQLLALDFQEVLQDIQEFVEQPIVILGRVIALEGFLPDTSIWLDEGIATIPENALNLLEATSRNLIWTLVVVATTYYLLRDWERLRDWVFHQIPESEQDDARQIYARLKTIWLGYFRGNLALMFIVGVAFTIAWLLIGLPGAVILGVITGLLTIIPDLGPAIAAALAVLVALVEGSNTLAITNIWFALLVFVIYLVLINIKGIWLRPRIFARSVHMHDGVVFVAILAAVVLQGILGAIVVVPLMASFGVLFRYTYRRLLNLDPFS
jgi:predicted PurR-regulated permease PerM